MPGDVDVVVTLALGLATTYAIASEKTSEPTTATLLAATFHGLRAGSSVEPGQRGSCASAIP